jgi:predicted membrane-bound spermidine synthase
MTLYLLFFLSGAAALVFETLWFRQAAVVFGNTVWASTIVLASFMAGLAVGNAWTARVGHRVARPLRAYAILESAVAVGGLCLVLGMPHFAGAFAPLFRRLADQPALLQTARVGLAFLLMVVPAAAMGATLPVVVRAVTARGTAFGPALGALYGWNTVGAVAGALAGECLFIEWLGLRGTGSVAAALDLVAAALAWRLSNAHEATAAPAEKEVREEPARPKVRRGFLVLGAAALSGALLLALEVVWFRLLSQFVIASSIAFTFMLVAVLAGIACGGWAAGAWLVRRPEAGQAAPAIALGASAATLITYRLPDRLMGGDWGYTMGETAWSSACLMFPTALCSGMLFTLLGRRLRDEIGEDTAATGWLTLANTAGAAVGAVVGGFVLLPGMGMERSIASLGAAYLVPAGLALAARRPTGNYARATAAAMALYVGALVGFPSGLMERAYRARIVAYWSKPGTETIAWKETAIATLLYTRYSLFSEPVSHRLLTNGSSMASTDVPSRRYMKQYVYWPVALHPAPRRALLICFGLGSTAAALADTRELTSIDVVDVSPEVLEMGRLALRPGHRYPLDDPRVKVHVDDGRFFLLTRDTRYDIITSEPPPPKCAGIVNLYTSEYFHLIRSRLAAGGMATYWLPVHDLSSDEAAAILKGFCAAFEDCSLWNGDSYNWMLAGSNGADYTPSAERLHRQWQDPNVAAELATVGFDSPAALFATYMADAPHLNEWARATRPLVDDFPHRLRPWPAPPHSGRPLRTLVDADAARERFRSGAWPRRLGGGAVVDETLRLFDLVGALNRTRLPDNPHPYDDLARVLRESPSPWLSLALLGADPDKVAAAERAAARNVRTANVSYLLAVGAATRRDFAQAERFMAEAQAQLADVGRLAELRALFLCLQGRPQDAWAVIDEWSARRQQPLSPRFQSWALQDCRRTR